MRLLNWEITRAGQEQRSGPTLETISVSASPQMIYQFFGMEDLGPASVTIDEALEVPAVWAAVSFLSRTLGHLPLHAYKRNGKGADRENGPIEALVNHSPNPEWTAFDWRRYGWQQTFTGGRQLTWIERDTAGKPVALWPMDPTKTRVKMVAGKKIYVFGRKEYPAADVIDVPFMLRADQLSAYGPISKGARSIRLALAMSDYGRSFFSNGGVPPLAMKGPLATGKDAQDRQLSDMNEAISAARRTGNHVVPLPSSYSLEPIGFEPQKGQLTDALRFQIEETARLYNLPPVFLQDLTNGTFSNVEQQDLHLTKHLIAQWAEALEQELNLKLFGGKGDIYVEHNLDGLLRGDFKTRTEGYAQAVQNAIRTPDECRVLEGLPPLGGDAAKLHIQGATVPLGEQPKKGDAPPPKPQGAAG